MATQKKPRKTNQYSVDKSGEADFFTMVPRLVQMVSRSPYDLALFTAVKDIAGENGTCFVTTEKLAWLSKMSIGKVNDCRNYLIRMGFLEGEKKGYYQGGPSTWVIKIVNVWSKNTEWSKAFLTIDSRVEYAKKMASKQGGGYIKNEKICKRCVNTFTATGRRHKYCDSCAQQRKIEEGLIYKMIKMPKKDYIGDYKCKLCGTGESLELHLANPDDKWADVICTKCHDKLHKDDPPINVTKKRVDLSPLVPPTPPKKFGISPYQSSINGQIITYTNDGEIYSIEGRKRSNL